MTKPTKYPEWAITDVILPQAGTTNKLEPDVTLQQVGFDFLTLPECQEENWWRNNVYGWVKELNEQGIYSWDATTVYPIGAVVKGSDTNIYKAVLSQAGNDPTVDVGTNWINLFADGSETVKGLVELATQAEVDGDTGGSRVITSDTLNNWSGNPTFSNPSAEGYWLDNTTGFFILWNLLTIPAGATVNWTFPLTVAGRKAVHVTPQDNPYSGADQTESYPIITAYSDTQVSVKNHSIGDNAGTFLSLDVWVTVIGHIAI